MTAATSPTPPAAKPPRVWAPCQHCGIRPGKRRRHLCSRCYYGHPEIRELHAPNGARGNRGVLDDKPRKGESVYDLGTINKRVRKKPPPTTVRPGPDKVEVMAWRAAQGMAVFNRRDASYAADAPETPCVGHGIEPGDEEKWMLDHWDCPAPPSPYVGPVLNTRPLPDGQGRFFLAGITLLTSRRTRWGEPGLAERIERAARRRRALAALRRAQRTIMEMLTEESCQSA